MHHHIGRHFHTVTPGITFHYSRMRYASAGASTIIYTWPVVMLTPHPYAIISLAIYTRRFGHTLSDKQFFMCNQSWDMDILKCNKYCILNSIALIHVKIEIKKKTTLKLLYMIDYFWFNKTKWFVNLSKIQLWTNNQSWDMNILKWNKYGILCSIAQIHVKFAFKKLL